jgi:hypothetical protein
VGRPQVDPRRAPAQARDQVAADGHGLLEPSGQRQRLEQAELGSVPHGRGAQQAGGAAERLPGCGQSAPLQRRQARFDQEQPGPFGLIGLNGQVGGRIAVLGTQAGVGRLERVKRGRRQRRPRRRQHVGGDRLPGQGVPEPELPILHREQEQVRSALERPGTTTAGWPVAEASSRQSRCRPRTAAARPRNSLSIRSAERRR